MNENYIAYETLVANRAAAEWACWAMIASWVSAGAYYCYFVFGVQGIVYVAGTRENKSKNRF